MTGDIFSLLFNLQQKIWTFILSRNPERFHRVVQVFLKTFQLLVDQHTGWNEKRDFYRRTVVVRLLKVMLKFNRLKILTDYFYFWQGYIYYLITFDISTATMVFPDPVGATMMQLDPYLASRANSR